MKTNLYLFVFLTGSAVLLHGCSPEQVTQKPNILFIALDDLRPELGCYGNQEIISPNMDRLASEGLVFNRTYCQQAICMASRASLMSGLRPDTLNIYNTAALEDLAPGIPTINQQFQKNGYTIWTSGKIYHHGIDRKVQFGENNHEPETKQVGRGYLAEESVKIMEEYDAVFRARTNQPGGGRGPAYEYPDVPDNAYADGAMTDMAIEQLAQFKTKGEPFFMAVGYHKPHLPFNAPKKYWDMYNRDEIKLADNPYLPADVSRFFDYTWGELRNYAGIPTGRELLSDSLSRTLKHGYYACVSYVDAQIGRLLDALKQNGLDENTIVILWGDHGWKLGEHGMWCKHTQFELDNHVPLLLKVPGMKKPGAKTNALVEFVDIYPSLCELAGLEIPAHVQGTSFAPLVNNPDLPWKKGAISIWPQNRDNPGKVILGCTIQTDRYRYTEWIHQESGEVVARDLFDHQNDPDENQNISNNPASEQIIAELSTLLDKGKGWKAIDKSVMN